MDVVIIASIATTGAVGLAGITATFFAPSWNARQDERRRRDRDLRAATRLVASDLSSISVACLAAAESRSIDQRVMQPLGRASGWESYKELLASAASEEGWRGVASVFGRFEAIKMLFAERSARLDDSMVEDLRTLGKDAEWVRDGLAPGIYARWSELLDKQAAARAESGRTTATPPPTTTQSKS